MRSLLALTGWAWLLSMAPAVCAHDTNDAPRTRLEAIELATGRVVIKGTEEIGTLVTKNGEITVRCQEYQDVSASQKILGLAITVRQNDVGEDTTTIDDDEIAALLSGLDYVSKADPSVSSLNHFEAAYTSRAGLRIATYSSRRTSGVEASVTSQRYVRSKNWLSMVHLAQFKNLLEQGQTKLNNIRKSH